MSNIKQSLQLPVMEMFYTIQGEGFNSGAAAFFIRLGGCDVGCPWCDVKESWEETAHPVLSISDIVSEVKKHPAKNVVITGGEPLMHNLDELCKELKSSGTNIFLETSGAYPLSGAFDWICVSPKKFKAPLKEMIQAADELKAIVFNKSDFVWAEKNAALVSKKCLLYLQPEWEKSELVLPLIIDYVKAHPEWKISLQTHKWIQVP